MLTPSHGLLAWLAGKYLYRDRPEMTKFLIIGSIFSDLIMISCGIAWFIGGNRHPWDAYKDIMVPAFVVYPTKFLHSFFVATLAYLILKVLAKSSVKIDKIKVLLSGWAIFHLIIDFLTHQKYAHEHFWPFSDYKFHSFISDEGAVFLSFDLVLLAITLALLFGYMSRRLIFWWSRRPDPR